MGFSQTCNKLSQFLKERRSLGDFEFPNTSKLDINVGGKEMSGASTMTLFPKNNITMGKKEGNVSKGEESFKSWDFFPSMSSPSRVGTEVSTKNLAQNRELPTNTGVPTTASMTIFYGGKVLVFDDLPEEKALEIMSFASQGTFNSLAQTQTQTQIQIPIPNHTIIKAESTQGEVLQEQPNLSDLPIARRVSLHRFIEKRKNRIAGNAPYLLHNSSMGNYKKDEFMGNIDDQQSETQLELNLFK